jgi:hypothetical protein
MWRFGSSNLSAKEAHLQRQQDVAVLHELLQAFDDCAVSHALVQEVLQVIFPFGKQQQHLSTFEGRDSVLKRHGSVM